jgi:molybdate transport repressor ModE-like protein
MIRIEIEPVWRFTKDDGSGSMLVMMDLLQEIRASGKITRAADQSHMSYRHAWNQIEKWSAFFGARAAERR